MDHLSVLFVSEDFLMLVLRLLAWIELQQQALLWKGVVWYSLCLTF
jgi:hypothetical protein